jgi:hypothetical protein
MGTHYSLQEKRYEEDYWFIDLVRYDNGLVYGPGFCPGGTVPGGSYRNLAA